MIRVVFWAMLGAMLAVYGSMLFWSLPKLSALSGGQVMFDLRPGGYSMGQARDILTALGDEGRAFYQNVQHRLDLVYPALMAGVLIMSYWRLFKPAWATGFGAIAVLAAAFDYLENAAVSTMLTAGPADLTAEMAAAASRWTQVKSIVVSVAMTLLLIGLIRAGWRRWRG